MPPVSGPRISWSVGFWAAALTLVVVPRAAFAQAPPAHLTYHAPADCPSEADFRAAVMGRGAHIDGPPDGNAARSVEITLGKQPEGALEPFGGKIVVSERGGAATSREVSGPSCKEVAVAMAVIVAIELGPERQGVPAPSATEPPTQPGPTRPEAPTSLKHVRAFPGSLDFGAAYGLVPGVGATGEMSFDFLDFYTAGKDAALSIPIEMYGGFVLPTSVATSSGRATVGAAYGGLGICLYRIGHVSLASDEGETLKHGRLDGLTVKLCTRLEVGALLGESSPPDSFQNQTTRDINDVFAGTNLLGQARYAIGGRVSLVLDVGVTALLKKAQVLSPDGTQIYSSAPLWGRAALGLGVDF